MKKPRVILVTGAAQGLGLATAQNLAGKGHQVIVTARDRLRGENAAKSAGGIFVILDVLDSATIASAVNEVVSRFGRLDTLVNNAAIVLDSNIGVLEVPPADYSKTIETNTIAPLRLSQAFLPLLRKSETPRIVNVSSGAGQLGDGTLQNWAPAYSASKSALNSVTQQLAAALPGFAVNSVCPGWCRTELGGPQAPRSVEQGADTISWLAGEADQSLTGRFWRDRVEIPW